MNHSVSHLLLVVFFLLHFISVSGQEVLRSSKIQARANRRYLPSLGLPERTDGEIDAVIRFREGRWEGSVAAESAPVWTMVEIGPQSPAEPKQLRTVIEFCRGWAQEKPKGSSFVVYGPLRDGWFVTVCKKTRTVLGWKSIAFVIPSKGIDEAKSIYLYSKSVNWVEHFINYNLYPKLPSYCQEIIEEMTATELLCPYQEFETELVELPEPELIVELEQDYRGTE